MKVIEVCSLYFPHVGGISTHVRHLSEGLSKKGVEVVVYTTEPASLISTQDIIRGVRVKRFPSLAYKNSYFISPSLFQALQRAHADIIHAHGFHDFSALTAALAKRNNRVSVVATLYYHGSAHTFGRNILFYPYRKVFGKYVLSKSDLLICVSEYEKRLIESHLGPKTRTVIIPVCCGLDARYLDTRRWKDSATKKILYAGRLEEYKGIQYLTEAFGKMNREIDAKLWIIGEGPYEKALRLLVKKLGLSDRVIFSRRLYDLSQEYLSSDVVVLPSQRESFNIVAVEALAAGTPVITTPVGEPYTLIREGLVTGIKTPIDSDEIRDKIEMIISQGRKGNTLQQRYILERYSNERVIDETLDAYTNLLNLPV